MRYIQVTAQDYLSPDSATSRDGKHWEAAKPMLLFPNLRERFIHWRGNHFTFGQPYCVVCGKEEKLN